MTVKARALLLVGLLLAGASAWAQPSWSELSTGQRQGLARFAERWDSLPADKRAQLLNNYQRWKQMSPADRERARERHEQFKSLPPEQREALRDCYRRKRAGEAVECKGR